MYDQLAICCRHQSRQDDLAKRWKVDVEDQVTAIGFNAIGELITNTARLLFDHASWPMEFEILHYISGWNWLDTFDDPKQPAERLSHFGIHVESRDEIEDWKRRYETLQEVVTVNQTNEGAKDRRYHYVILRTKEDYGATIKLIRRLTVEEGNQLLQEFMLSWSKTGRHRIG